MISSAQAAADSFRNCAPQQARIAAQSLDAAKSLTLQAAAAVGDTADYARWFGPYSQGNAEKVRATLKAIVTAMRGGGVTVQCSQIAPDGCATDEYAYVYSDRPYLLYLCPSFFSLPGLAGLRPGAQASDFGTREGTIVHEISHFRVVADTEDYCYSRSDCRVMARQSPARAIGNADSYQYFTEDIAYYRRQPVAGKPTRDAR